MKMTEKIRTLIEKYKDTLWQFIKFGLVGVSNTAISYGTEMLCYYVLFRGVPWPEAVLIPVVSAIAFVISTINSYYWNNRFVFRHDGKKRFVEHLKTYGKTVICYGVTGLVLAPLLKIWLTGLSVPYWLASLGTLIITIPLNFLLNKFWAYREKEDTK